MNKPYRKYFKPVPEGVSEIDVYMVHKMFNLQDPCGALHHASKKILLCGERTGGKSKLNDIIEARDALNRWINLHKDELTAEEEPAPAQDCEVRDGIPVGPSKAESAEYYLRLHSASQIPSQFLEGIKLHCTDNKTPVDFYVEQATGKKMLMVVAHTHPTTMKVKWNVLYSEGASFREMTHWCELSAVCAWLTNPSRPRSWATRGRRVENLVPELQSMLHKPVVRLS